MGRVDSNPSMGLKVQGTLIIFGDLCDNRVKAARNRGHGTTSG